MAFELLPEEIPQSIKQEPSIQQDFPTRLAEQGKEFVENAAQTGARLGSRALETVAGFGGDVFNLLNEFVAGPTYEKITGEKALPYEETYLGKVLKPSSYFQEQSEKLSKGYTSPKNKVDKFLDDVVKDTTSLLFRFGNVKNWFSPSPTKAAITSIGSNLIGEGVKDLSGDEKKGAYAKAGSMFLLSLLNKPSAASYAADLYKKARSALPVDATQNASALSTNLNNLKDKVLAGRPSTALSDSEKFILNEVDKVLGLVKDGKININSAWAAKRSLNENLVKVLYDTPERTAKAGAKKLATEIQHNLKNTIEDYGAKNTSFGVPFKEADQAFGTIAQSNVVSKFVDNNLKYKPEIAGLVHLLGFSAGVATGVAPYQTGKLLYRIYKSPVLAKYYGNVLKAATDQNVQTFNRELEKLDKALKKEEKTTRFELMD